MRTGAGTCSPAASQRTILEAHAVEVLREELYGSSLRIEPRPPGRALDETEMSALGRDLQRDGAVGRARDAVRGNERVVRCGEEQQRNPHALDEAPAGALRVVVRRAAE